MILRNPSLGLIDVYEATGNRTVPRWRTGSSRSFYSRPVAHRDFVFPLDFSQKTNQEYLIRVRSAISMQLPFSIQSYDGFWAKEQYNLARIGLFFGMALVMVIFNLFIFLMIGDRSYIPYVIFVISLTTFLGTLEGLGFQFFWPTSAKLNASVITVSLSTSAASIDFYSSIGSWRWKQGGREHPSLSPLLPECFGWSRLPVSSCHLAPSLSLQLVWRYSA